MIRKTFAILFFSLIFALANPVNSAANTIICWDGTYVIDIKTCDDKPQAQTFSMFGSSAEGAEVSTFIIDDKVRLIEVSEFGEMGKAEYTITNSKLVIWSTRYNQPFYMDGFDPEKSTKNLESYRIEKTENGNALVSGDKDQLSNKRADRLACIINAINKHIAQSNGVPTTLQLDCY